MNYFAMILAGILFYRRTYFQAGNPLDEHGILLRKTRTIFLRW